VVRGVFNEKFAEETNNTFGKVVREAFAGVSRGRDGGGYIYRPLKGRCLTVDKQMTVMVHVTGGDNNHQVTSADKSIQTFPESPKDVSLKTKFKYLETKSILLKKREKSLKRELSNIKQHNRKLKEALSERRRTELKDAHASLHTTKSTMAAVNMIHPDELEKEAAVTGIGEGSYGECSLYRFKRTGNLVVIKSLKQNQRNALIREARAMQSVTSQRFPFIYGVQLTQPPYSIVMQFIGSYESKRSCTLHNVLATKEPFFLELKQGIQRKDWISICQDFADGLCHLHDLRLLHNDLKSNNVLVHNKRGYIIDLGKSCEASSPPPGKKYSHPYNHIAPEVLQGGCFTYESDIFSLGQILNLVVKFGNIFELREIVQQCMNNTSVMRPTARIIIDKLTTMQQ